MIMCVHWWRDTPDSSPVVGTNNTWGVGSNRNAPKVCMRRATEPESVEGSFLSNPLA